ncbi:MULTISPECIES: F0F1 ATP synthase subunit epsilon [Rhodomicrobium]|uniref:F0F1 ATP synthase subunit epsilon n=1 Tax=Rhodomicrobium TaxID=1068 RepID=UPI000B4C0B4B|nr:MULTISPECIES: F0F1 ATP synthase subunit epsilon [Rhodomicrobium]
MAETFKFELVSPERLLVSADVGEVLVPGSEGDFTVLPRHAPVIAMLRPGVLRIPEMSGELAEIYVRGGLADVGPDKLVVLAEQAVPLGKLQREFLAREIKEVEDLLAETQDEDVRRLAVDTLERLLSLRETLNLAA